MRSYTQILILSLNTLPVFKNKKKTFSKIKLLKAGGSDSKRSAYSAGDPDSIPGSGRSPREGNGNPLHYSCLENSMDIGAWWATVHGDRKSQTRLSDSHTHMKCMLKSN